MKLITLALVLASMVAGAELVAGNTPQTATPVLVELFTSEGCSSCPPADGLLEKMDTAQPIPGAQLIVLSEHVDYWNHDGWTDPFSSTALTERQDNYGRALKDQDVYTPQFIVDGSIEMQIDNPQRTFNTLQKAAAKPKIAVQLSSLQIDTQDPPVLHGRVNIDADSGLKNKADVYIAVALNRAESQVLHGENGGRHLSHVAVVENLSKLGKAEKGKDFDKTFEWKLKPGISADNLRVVAFVQEPGPGPVVGAALAEVGKK